MLEFGVEPVLVLGAALSNGLAFVQLDRSQKG